MIENHVRAGTATNMAQTVDPQLCKATQRLCNVAPVQTALRQRLPRTIPDMIQRFGLVTGLSDHTLDNTTAITSVAMGASIIEKHFTLDRKGGGPDDSFSLEPAELAALCKDSKTAWAALGRVDYGRKSSEVGNVKFRRSLYVVEDIEAGDVLTSGNLRRVRPGFGLPPKHLEALLGKKINRHLKTGTPMSLDYLG